MIEPAAIELGEVRDQPEPERGPRDPRRHRTIALLAALALGAGLGGAAPAVEPLAEARVPMALGESMEVDGDRLYVISPHRNQPAFGDRRIIAYRLPDGKRLWQAQVGGSSGEFGTLTTIGGTLLLVRYDQTGAGEVIGMDADTGTQRWRRPGWVVGWTRHGTAGRLLMGSGAGVPGSSGQLELVTAVDLTTGEPSWTYRPPPGALVQTTWNDSDGGDSYLATGLRSGRVEVRDPATGNVLAVADTGTPIEPVVPDQVPDWLTLVGDLLMIQSPDRGTLTAYGLPALDRRWSTPFDRGRIGWFTGPTCGDALCLQSSSDSRVKAVDLDTGRTRWTAAWSYLEQAGTSLLASRADGPFGGESPLALVDPATGRAQAELGSWAIAGRRSVGDPLLISQDLVTQRTWFGAVDPARRDVRLIGVARGVVGECWAGVDCLVCRRRDLTIGIWRYR
jgi:outer membrane protein assembly factor BamB